MYNPYFVFLRGKQSNVINSEYILIKYILTYLLLIFPLFIFCQENNNLTIGDFDQMPDSTGFVSSPIDTLYSEFQETDTLEFNSPANPVIDAPIVYSAEDSVIISLDGQKAFLYNKAKVTYQKIELTAYYIEIDFEARELYAEGVLDSTGTLVQKPIFKEGTEEAESETLRYNFKTQKGITTKVVTKQGEGFIHSERTKKITADVFFITRGKYTVCDADDPHFYFHLSQAKVISNNKIVTGPAWMVLEDFPIYFPILPFGFFPVTSTYSSGILIPSYGEELNRGFYLQDGGYYWAASEYFDVSARGSIYTKGSWDGKFSTSYVKRYKYRGNLNFTYAKNKYGEKWLDTYSATKQFAFTWSHSQDAKANPSQQFSASVNFSTSGFDKQNSNLTSADNYLTTSKSSSITFSKRFDNTPFNASVSLNHSQNSRDTTINLTMPELRLNMSKVYPFKSKNRVGPAKWYQDFGITYTGEIKNQISAKEYEVLNKSLVNDWGNGIRHSIPIALPGFNLFNYFNFSPGISYNEKWYFKKYSYEYRPGEPGNSIAPQNVFAKVINGLNRVYDYSFNLSSSTNIYGNYVPLNPNSRISSIRHKMSPSIGFSYRPDFGASRYGYYQPVQVDETGKIQYLDVNRNGIYGGSPGQGASGSITFSLSNSVEMKVLDAPRSSSRQVQTDEEGNETDNKASAEKYNKVKVIDDISFRTSYNLIADSMNLSDISISARTTIKGVSVNAGGVVSPYVLTENGPINKFTWNEKRGLDRLGRLTRANLSFGMQFRSKQGRKAADDNRALIEGDGKILPGNYSDYVDFNIPWDFSYDYSFTYSGPRRPGEKGKITQTLGLRGSLSLTEKWRMSTNTNFDIMARQFSFTQFNVTRDLHCFQMSFNFVPFGYRKSYNFLISARSSILKDLKLTKNRSFLDNM